MSENSNFSAIFGGSVPSQASVQDFGSFRSELDQTLSPSLLAQQIGLEITDNADGVGLNADGTIGFSKIGYYMVEATIVFLHTGAITTDTGYVYLVLGGVNILGSTRIIRLSPNVNTNTLSVSYLIHITDTSAETLELYFTATSTDVKIDYTTFATIPNSSSVIVNIFQILSK